MAGEEREKRLAELRQSLVGLEAVRTILGETRFQEAREKIQLEIDRLVQTSGRADIEGTVNTGGGDNVGRDQNKLVVQGDLSVSGVAVVGDQNIINLPDPAEAAAKQQAAARRGYLKELRATCQALPLAAMGEDESAGADITLDQIYIDLDTTAKVKVEKEEKKRSKKQVDFAARPGEDERPVTALEAAAGSPRLVLLGDPGAGKSTFVRRLAAWLAAAGLGEAVPPTGIDPGLTPILVTLRDLAPRLNIPGFDALPAARRQAALLEALHDQVRAELALLGNEAPAYADGLLENLGGGRCLLVLDGLDEVPYTLRERVRTATAVAIQRYRVERVILTCRVRSYSGASVFADFTAFTLAPFDEDKIRAFSRAWYNTQLQLKRVAGEDQARKRAESLAGAALALEELASNPMLLTSMAIIHQRDIGLPEQRVRLYNLVVDVLIRRWQKHKTGELQPSPALEAFFKDDLRLRAALERLGYEAHRASTGQENQAGDLLRIRAIEILEAREHLGDPGLANEFLDYVDQRAGLLAGRGGELDRPISYGFPHRSLQEYLAGCYLAGQRDLFGALYQHAGEGEGWDLAVQLGFEELYYNRRGANNILDLAYHICASCDTAGPQKQRALLWSGQAAALVGQEAILEDGARPDGGEGYLGRIRGRLVEVMGGQLPPVERGEAGDALARLGDPRAEVMTVEGMSFAFIPAGPFRMGEGKETHDVDLPAFWLARRPVTNAQYDAFVSAGGYAEARRWPEAEQAGYWKDGVFKGRFDDEGRAGRFQVPEPYNLPNHPAVVVTWYEALAFTRWLEELARRGGWLKAGWKISLPSEAEWEKAARGGAQVPRQPGAGSQFLPLAEFGAVLSDPQRIKNPLPERAYPWGKEFDPNKANTSGSGVNSTSAAGCFPGGCCPYGIEELAGNVWEWTRSAYRDYPYDPKDGREELTLSDNVFRVCRGGSWYFNETDARCAFRRRPDPNDRRDYLGFRVVVLPSSTLGSGSSDTL